MNHRSHREGGLEVTKSSIEGEPIPIPDVQGGTHLKSLNQRAAQVSPVWSSITVIVMMIVHVAAIYGVVFVSPIHKVSKTTLLLCFLGGQLGSLGITMGYHRLWSHRSFVASEPLRWFLALTALFGMQGSIKWWCIRHRIHHRWTDTKYDPYNAKRGLFFSHIGWLLYNPRYEKLNLIDRADLENDRVVVLQHRYYIPLGYFMGFILPHLLSTYIFQSNQHSRWDGLIWGGLVVKLWVWHSAFTTNSLAHYLGKQPFNLDLTARGNFWLALLTLGEGNHNFHHLFARDYRSGPARFDWDPTKWVIYLLYRYTNLVTKIHRTPESDIEFAKKRVIEITSQKKDSSVSGDHNLSEFPSFDEIVRFNPDPQVEEEDDRFDPIDKNIE
ncbi:hypothetical protein DFH28DRAFT_631238 [Melampsora americana]|nr:hypothetical protein DFH28DRAFT_631238 [Melampsora americana]